MRRLAVAGVVLALLGACTGASSQGTASSPTSEAPVQAKSCSEVACEGSLDGARYRILLPQRWNGTLLLYSHGYRFAQPVPPDFATPATDAVPAPGEDVAKALLDDGYALAGSSYSRNGWAVPEGVRADEQLYAFFAQQVGTPRRVYLWGDSLGGLVTETLAEKAPPWVSGAAPLCGVLGGTNENLDVGLDVSYAVRTLIAPRLRLSGYVSHDEAVRQWQYAQRQVVATAARGGGGAASVAFVAALADAPDQTARFDGSTPVSRISAAVEAVLTGLGYGTYGRYEIEQRVDGDPSSNASVDYATRISPSERQLVDAIGGAGTTDALLVRLAAGPRAEGDASARQDVARTLGEPTGALAVPTVTLHTTKDPLVLVQNERLFADRVSRRGRQQRLLQVFVAPPTTYQAPAPYGAGHCAFTSQQRLAVVQLLDQWVRSGARPTGREVHETFADVPGTSTTYVPSPWPAESVR